MALVLSPLFLNSGPSLEGTAVDQAVVNITRDGFQTIQSLAVTGSTEN
jgi:hypothetical protein